MPDVVVIDDRVTNRNVLTRLAASVEEGVRVKAFASPHAALEWVSARHAGPGDHRFQDAGHGRGGLRPDHARAAEGVPRSRSSWSPCMRSAATVTKHSRAGATDFLLSPVDHHRVPSPRPQPANHAQAAEAAGAACLRAAVRAVVEHGSSVEAALRASELRLRRLIDTVPAMISAVDAPRAADPDQQRPQADLRDRSCGRDRRDRGPSATARTTPPSIWCSTPRCSRAAKPCRASRARGERSGRRPRANSADQQISLV